MPLTSSTPTKTWIDDFVHSKNPKFDGKSKKKRIQMALAASYEKKRNDSMNEEEKKNDFKDKKDTWVSDKEKNVKFPKGTGRKMKYSTETQAKSYKSPFGDQESKAAKRDALAAQIKAFREKGGEIKKG